MAAGAAPHAAGPRVRICRLPGPVPAPHAAGRAQTAAARGRTGANHKTAAAPPSGSRRFAERVRRALTGRA